jgi:hypothetical protein
LSSKKQGVRCAALSTTGEKFKKATPYDFIALTDHAEYLGVATLGRVVG